MVGYQLYMMQKCLKIKNFIEKQIKKAIFEVF